MPGDIVAGYLALRKAANPVGWCKCLFDLDFNAINGKNTITEMHLRKNVRLG